MKCILSLDIFRPSPLTPVSLHPAPPSFYGGKILLQAKVTAPCPRFADALAAHHCRTRSLHLKRALYSVGKGKSWEMHIYRYFKIRTEGISDLRVTHDIVD